VRVTFAGIDFSEEPWDRIDFSGFEFGDEADFSQCKWRGTTEVGRKAFASGRASFAGAAFGDRARFAGAAFGGRASFAGAAFGDFASFDGAAFGGIASFDGAAFGDGARFAGAAFGDGASFAGAAFGDLASFAGAAFGDVASFAGAAFDGASFDGAAFGDFASFAGAAFGDEASFDNAHFKGRVEFTGMSEEQWARDMVSRLGMDEEARVALEKRHKDSRETTGSRLDRFLTISFSGARFDGVAVFSGRSFEKTANFTNARFCSPPDFEFCGGTTRIDFTGAYIGFARSGHLHWTSKTAVPVGLRAFRKIAEETKNHDLERDLYIEERKAERGVYLIQRWQELKNEGWKTWPRSSARLIAHCLWIGVMGVYWALSNYGRSFVIPAAWLIASWYVFYQLYLWILSPLMAKAGPLADKYARVVGMVAFGNTVPFVGPLTIDSEIKKFLFCPGFGPCLPIPPEGYQLLVLSQNLLSIILVFFIGLALRNYFRIK
jgi:Pentapeptide repeats (9 copies)